MYFILNGPFSHSGSHLKISQDKSTSKLKVVWWHTIEAEDDQQLVYHTKFVVIDVTFNSGFASLNDENVNNTELEYLYLVLSVAIIVHIYLVL